MSIECGECERDLRGGHDISCSRYDVVSGVARAMMKADGRYDAELADDEFEIPGHLLRVANAAILHLKKVEEARK